MDDKRLKQIFSNMKTRSLKSKMTDSPFDVEFEMNNFISWYNKTKENLNNKCAYCGSDQNKITQLIEKKTLSSKRFNKRGFNLEVDRKDPKKNYSEENCTLICYFCNNDKSDIFLSDDYQKYFINMARCKNGKTMRCNYIDDMYELLKN